MRNGIGVGNGGFTLVELVIVIVILGILTATALPRFVDFSGDAEQAVTSGVAGAISSASTLNSGQFRVSAGLRGRSISGTSAATVCDPLPSLLDEGMPAGYSLTLLSGCVDESALCRVMSPKGFSATAFVSCTG